MAEHKGLVFDILRLCGVKDLAGINHVSIEVTPSKFHVHIQQNAHIEGRPFMVEGKTVVQQFTDFDIVNKTTTTGE